MLTPYTFSDFYKYMLSPFQILDSELDVILGYMFLETWRVSATNRYV